MRVIHFFILYVLFSTGHFAYTQNVSINILTQKGGVAKSGDTVFLEITILNTDQADTLAEYKIRPQISIPGSVVKTAASGQQLPDGWSITQQESGVIRVTNGTDRIPPNDGRLIILKLIGITPGGPHKIAANLMFSNGSHPGTVPGTSTKGDSPADNTSSTTCHIQ